MSFKYEIEEDYDFVFDEKNNSFLALRKVQWGGKGDFKLDIRKWYTNAEGEEVCGKGVSFLTEEGPHELTKVLVEQGFGNKEELIEILNNRVEEDEDTTDYLNIEDILL